MNGAAVSRKADMSTTYEQRGRYRVVSSIGRISGATIYTLQYQPPSDHPGFPIWEDVRSSYDRDDFDGRPA